MFVVFWCSMCDVFDGCVVCGVVCVMFFMIVCVVCRVVCVICLMCVCVVH